MTSSVTSTSLQGPCCQKEICNLKKKKMLPKTLIYLVLPSYLHILKYIMLPLPIFLQLNRVFIKSFNKQSTVTLTLQLLETVKPVPTPSLCSLCCHCLECFHRLSPGEQGPAQMSPSSGSFH